MTRKSVSLAVGTTALIAALLSSCSTTQTGSIKGVFYGLGNQATHVGGVPDAGEITASGAKGSYPTSAGSNGRFSVDVPAGSYRIVGRDAGQTGGISSCVAHADVSAGRTTRVAVTCVFH
jgi:hypothetical protein